MDGKWARAGDGSICAGHGGASQGMYGACAEAQWKWDWERGDGSCWAERGAGYEGVEDAPCTADHSGGEGAKPRPLAPL